MFKHEKELFHPVAVERPNPQYAAILQEQLGGGNGELKAAMQYMAQSFRIKDPEINSGNTFVSNTVILHSYCITILLFRHGYNSAPISMTSVSFLKPYFA